MSHMADSLSLPAGFPLPEPLERAWTWLEAQGWGTRTEHGYFLTPYAGDVQLGVVFSPDLTTEGWIEPGAPGSERLIPIAEIAGDGSVGALWLDDTDAERFVALGSGGELFRLADSAVDFLRLIAIGHDEVAPFLWAEAPEDPETIEAHAAFRDWVEQEFSVTVPEIWEGPADDGFSDWVWAHTGQD